MLTARKCRDCSESFLARTENEFTCGSCKAIAQIVLLMEAGKHYLVYREKYVLISGESAYRWRLLACENNQIIKKYKSHIPRHLYWFLEYEGEHFAVAIDDLEHVLIPLYTKITSTHLEKFHKTNSNTFAYLDLNDDVQKDIWQWLIAGNV